MQISLFQVHMPGNTIIQVHMQYFDDLSFICLDHIYYLIDSVFLYTGFKSRNVINRWRNQ